MTFEEEFYAWLSCAMQSGVTEAVKAFSFNLFEPARIPGVKFGVELIGASQFDENDPDWACDEAWSPPERALTIPVAFSGEQWEECLSKISHLVAAVLATDLPTARLLKTRQGIGVGFVDGDLHVIWPG